MRARLDGGGHCIGEAHWGEEALSVSPGVRPAAEPLRRKQGGQLVGRDGLCTLACLRYSISIYQPRFRFGSLTFT